MPNQQRFPRSRYFPAGVTLVLGIGLSFLAWAILWNWENRRQNYEFNRRIDDIAIGLERQLNADLDVILVLGDYVRASAVVERSSFARFVNRPLGVRPSLQVLAWSPRVSAAERQKYEAAASSQTKINVRIAERDSQGRLLEAGKRAEYFPVYYVEPAIGNEKILGFDLGSDPVARSVLEQARDTGEMVVTSQVNLIEEKSQELMMLAIQPIYQNGVQPTTVAARRQLLTGFVLGAFRAADLFQSSLKGRNTNFLNLYLASGDRQTDADAVELPLQEIASGSNNRFTAIYESSQQQVRPGGTDGKQVAGSSCPLQLSDDSAQETACSRLLKIAGHQWTLYVLATPEFRKTQKHWRSWGTLLMGLFWTLIPVSNMLTSLTRTAQIEKLALERSRQAKQLHEAYKQLEAEQAKSEQLLLNVLPQPIAERLKKDEHNIADSFPEVSVLFADIVGFTELSSRIAASALVEVLNDIFSAFDHLAERHGLEKIKTIGDAYMVVGGLPTPRQDHAQAIAEMALDMQQEIRRLSLVHNEAFSIRIGINTGPVIAGVIGIKRFIYDLWGDTVNIASRMESHGITGCIQVTEATYKLLEHQYLFEKRGVIPVKGKGYMTTYLLLERKHNF